MQRPDKPNCIRFTLSGKWPPPAFPFLHDFEPPRPDRDPRPSRAQQGPPGATLIARSAPGLCRSSELGLLNRIRFGYGVVHQQWHATLRSSCMKRNLFDSDHDLFRETVAEFLKREVTPFHDQWEEDGIVPREVWTKAGEVGLLGHGVPEEYGGTGTDDFRYNTIVNEEV